MKCIDCGKNVGNWPPWLEDSRVTVRCLRCSTEGAAPINMPSQHTTLAPLTDLARRTADLVEAA